MMNKNIKGYQFNLKYSEEDQEWVATCPSFPSLSSLDEQWPVALAGIMRLVSDFLDEEEDQLQNLPSLPMIHRYLNVTGWVIIGDGNKYKHYSYKEGKNIFEIILASSQNVNNWERSAFDAMTALSQFEGRSLKDTIFSISSLQEEIERVCNILALLGIDVEEVGDE